MTIGLLFWIVFLVALIFGAGWGWPRDPANRYAFGSWVVLWVLLGLLGWAAFGSPIKG